MTRSKDKAIEEIADQHDVGNIQITMGTSTGWGDIITLVQEEKKQPILGSPGHLRLDKGQLVEHLRPQQGPQAERGRMPLSKP